MKPAQITPGGPSDSPDGSTPLRHSGACGRRIHCWRPECQARFGAYQTVEILDDGTWIAYCHRSVWHPRPFELVAA